MSENTAMIAWKKYGTADKTESRNHWIAETDERFLGFYREGYLEAETLDEQVISCGLLFDKSVVVYSSGDEEDAQQLPLASLLNLFDREILAIVFDRSLLQNSGRWNTHLRDGADYEFLCRLTESAGSCIRIPIQTGKMFQMSAPYADVCAYLYWRYVRTFDKAVQQVILQKLCAYPQFVPAMQGLLKNPECVEEIRQNTDPIALIVESDAPGSKIRCYGVVRELTLRLAESLKRMGEAVWTTSLDNEADQERLLNHPMKAVIGFEMSCMETEAIEGLQARKVQLWFDFPGFFQDLLRNLPEDNIVLCQDSFHADFIRKYYHTPNAFHFPLGGTDEGWALNSNRPYDIVFIGTCFSPKPFLEEDRPWFEFLVNHPQLDQESALLEYAQENNLSMRSEEVPDYFIQHKDATDYVPYEYRMRVVEKILCAGFQIHVYGDNWNNYNRKGKRNLIIHPACTPKQSLEEYGKAKIALNVMSCHKGGMTERIANILLSGAVCLTDTTTYIAEHFRDGEELCLFSMDQLERLPEIIGGLLEDEQRRSQIAQAGYQKAREEYTWEKRAEALLEYLED